MDARARRRLGCAAGIVVAPDGRGIWMVRLRNWSLRRRGKSVVVSREAGPAGPWFHVTWPGLVGAATALAPGRFAAALNQAPTASHRLGRIGDWAVNRWGGWRAGRTPPAALLRRVFEECVGFDDAARLLAETPLSTPAIYTLAGVESGIGVVIERQETAAQVHRAPFCVSNHWLSVGFTGRPRSNHSRDRLDMMRGRMAAAADGVAWLATPMRDAAARLAISANAATGELTVQNFEGGAPTTCVLRLVA